jgi:sugar lactone lactonase YvrE
MAGAGQGATAASLAPAPAAAVAALAAGPITALPVPASLLGESPFWHPDEGALYWCDIPGKLIQRYVPASAERTHPHPPQYQHWPMPSEPGCIAPLPGGGLLVALREGLAQFDPTTAALKLLAKAPYDPQHERFNDGKCDAAGRLWVGTIYEPRTQPNAALYRYAGSKLERMAGGVTVSNGLAFSPDARTLYWSDTTSHRIFALDHDPLAGTVSNRRVLAQFPTKEASQEGQQGHDGQLRQPGPGVTNLDRYGGRPDGAAVDAEGAYWVAMFEGQRLLRLAPDGHILGELRLPVRCPTMPCFGDADLKTLYITTSRERRPAEELAAQPWAGCVLRVRVPVAGLPVNFARL